MSEKSNADLGSIITAIVMVGMAWFLFGGGMDKTVSNGLQKINNQVANESVQKYDISKRSGTPGDMCVQAAFVAAAFLQAKDETNYRLWKKMEREDCANAGLPSR